MLNSKKVVKHLMLLCIFVFATVMCFGAKAYAADETQGEKEAKKYKIEYDLDGGINAPNAITQYSIEDGTISLPSPSKTGYLFVGWFYKKDFATGEYMIYGLNEQVIDIIKPEGDTITLYAYFMPYCIDVFYFEKNSRRYSCYTTGTNEELAPPPIQLGGDYATSYCEYTGYEPEGWVIGYYSNSIGNSRLYGDCQLFDDKVDFPISKTSFTYNEVASKLIEDGFKEKNLLNISIKWKPKKIAIKFDKNDNEAFGTMSDQFLDYTSKVKLNPCTFKKKGFELDHWSYTINSTEKTVADGASINSPTVYQESITLKANWKALNYTVKFDKNADDATGTMADMNFIYGATQKLNANKFERPGYTFAGWSLKSYTKSINTKNGDLLDGALANNLSDYDKTVTLYAVWEPNRSPFLVLIDLVYDFKLQPANV